MRLGHALSELGYDFFEEPIRPDDRQGYRRLSRALPIRLAAGESDYVAGEALSFLHDRTVGLIQPDVTRSGGITETCSTRMRSPERILDRRPASLRC